QLRYTMFVKSVKGRKLINPVVKRKGANGQTDIVAHAREADLRVDMTRMLLIVHMRFGVVTSKDSSTYFTDQIFEMPLPEGIGRYENRPRDMTWEQLVRREQEIAEELEHATGLSQDAELKAEGPGAGPESSKHVLNLKERVRYLVKLKRLHYVER